MLFVLVILANIITQTLGFVNTPRTEKQVSQGVYINDPLYRPF